MPNLSIYIYIWEFVKQAIETTVSKTIEEIPKQKQYRLWNKEVKDL